jgi:copper chaperone CopZ
MSSIGGLLFIAEFARMKACLRRETMTEEFTVTGMNCKNCLHHVENVAKGIAGVTKVKATLKEGRLIVQMNDDMSEQIVAAVTEIGYPTVISSK